MSTQVKHSVLYVLIIATILTFGLMSLSYLSRSYGQSPDAAAALVDVPVAPAAPAVAVVVPDPNDASGIAKAIYSAAVSGQWKVLAGLFLMLVVFVLRKYALGKIKWFATKPGGFALAMSTAVLGVVGLALASGTGIKLGILLNAVGTAATAAGIWEWAKDILKAKLTKAGA